MFVSELDRPWIDTPFLIQGFLVRDPREIASLRSHCNYAYVDPYRSAAGLLPSIPRKKSASIAASGNNHNGASRGEVIDLTGETNVDAVMSDTGRFMSMAQDAAGHARARKQFFGMRLLRALLGPIIAELPVPATEDRR